MSLLCKSKVKQAALDIAATKRPAARFSRVGNDFYVKIEAATRNAIEAAVMQHPSVGVTLK